MSIHFKTNYQNGFLEESPRRPPDPPLQHVICIPTHDVTPVMWRMMLTCRARGRINRSTQFDYQSATSQYDHACGLHSGLITIY